MTAYHVTSYQRWRQFGFISPLWRLRCGPSGTQQQAENIQTQTEQQQFQLAEQEQAQQTADRQQMQTLEAPLIAQQTAFASGDPKALLSAAMPQIAPLTQGYNAAREQIMNTVPPGAGRDAALAQLQIQQSTGIAGVESNLAAGAPSVLANVGAGLGAFSLQELGAALSGYTGAASTAGQVASEENASQANKVGLISGLTGAAGRGLSAFTLPSDVRLKKNAVPLGPILELLMQLRPMKYEYNSRAAAGFGILDTPGTSHIGLMAQEVFSVLPEAVGHKGEFLTLDYSAIAVVAVAAVKELADQVQNLSFQVTQLKARLNEVQQIC